MSTQVEKLENSRVKFVLAVSAEEFEDGLKYSFNKNKNKFNLQGFRKGKAPRKMVERMYGEGVLYDDGINYCLSKSYPKVVSELGLFIVAEPEFNVTKASKEEGLMVDVILTVKPDVTLGEYKGLTYAPKTVEIDEEDVNKALKEMQEKNSRLITVEGRPSQTGDTATIDFEGFFEGEAFEGGKAEDHELVLGSGAFIPGFEEQLLGHEVGDDVEVKVTFPEKYHAPELAGKEVTFQVEIKDLQFKELPELNDEFASDVSDFETLDEYINDIRKVLTEEKEHKNVHDKEDELLKQATENADFYIPEAMVERQIKAMVQEFEYRVRSQGTSLDMFLQYSGQTMEEFEKTLRPSAYFAVKSRLVLEKIAEIENFEVTDEEVQEEVLRVGRSYNIDEDKISSLFSPDDKEEIVTDIRVQKALQLIVSEAVEVA